MAHKRALESLLKALRRELPLLTQRYGVETVAVFGSYVRAGQKAGNNLDLLVTFREEPSLLTFIAIENQLSDMLGVKVDLVMKVAQACNRGGYFEPSSAGMKTRE